MSWELIFFFAYLVFMLAVGVYFFFKDKDGDEKTYFLGGRQLGPWVAAFSAGASDMSAWVLMGLPTSVYALGLGQVWIAVGLAAGYAASWIFEAPRLRRFSIIANDAITIPQYLTNRFLSRSKALQLICAVVFLVAYTVYSASSIKACDTLFSTVLGFHSSLTLYMGAGVIILYTFLGGFSAVCWTDFFQGLLILGSMLAAPLVAMTVIDFTGTIASSVPSNYWNFFTADWREIVSGLAWGLGYFGMPHIIIRFMSVRSQSDMKKSALIGISWTLLILLLATAIGVAGRLMIGMDETIVKDSLVFIFMVRTLCPAIISGILLSAVLAASMSTADSQLLAAASSFASDVYKPIIRKNQSSDKEMLWVGRIVVLAVAAAATLIAANPDSGSIMALVSNAWGVFGAAFGPTILLSLFWRRFNFQGAVCGIVVGALVDIIWMLYYSSSGIYELAPGFIAGFIFAVLATKITPAPPREVLSLYDTVVNASDE